MADAPESSEQRDRARHVRRVQPAGTFRGMLLATLAVWLLSLFLRVDWRLRSEHRISLVHGSVLLWAPPAGPTRWGRGWGSCVPFWKPPYGFSVTRTGFGQDRIVGESSRKDGTTESLAQAITWQLGFSGPLAADYWLNPAYSNYREASDWRSMKEVRDESAPGGVRLEEAEFYPPCKPMLVHMIRVPLWFLAMLWTRAILRMRRRVADRIRRGLCAACAYDLRGLSRDECPECDTPILPDQRRRWSERSNAVGSRRVDDAQS